MASGKIASLLTLLVALFVTGVVQAAQFVYVFNVGTGRIETFPIIESTGRLGPPAAFGDAGTGNEFSFTAALAPRSLAVDPLGRFAYALDRTGSNLISYRIDKDSGVLTRTDMLTLFQDTMSTVALEIDPDGQFAYVLNGSVSAYGINQVDGTLTSLSFADTFLEAGATGIAIHPAQRRAYITDIGGKLFIFDIMGDGLLMDLPVMVTTSGTPTSVTIAEFAGDDYVYVTSQNIPDPANPGDPAFDTAQISIFSIDDTTGLLTEQPPFVVPVGNDPLISVVHPDLPVLYVVNSGANSVSQFSINTADGSLTPLAPPSVVTGARPSSLALSFNADFAYVSNLGNTVTAYSINPASGVLSITGVTQLPSISVPGQGILSANPFSIATVETEPPALQTGTLQFSTDNFLVDEAVGNATITITRTGGTAGVASADFATQIGTALGSDFTSVTQTVTFADGDAADKTVQVPITSDDANEPGAPETVNLNLSNFTGATAGTPSTAMLAINDDDLAVVPGTLQFDVSNFSVSEADATATITITRTIGDGGAVSADLLISSGSATAGSDFTAPQLQTISFADGDSTSRNISINIVPDLDIEPDETVVLALANPVGGAILGLASAILTITNNDMAGSLEFDAGTYTVAEGAGNATIIITRTGNSTGAAAVTFSTLATGTATANTDFTPLSQVVNFVAGEVAKNVQVPIVQDTVDDDDETVNLMLTNFTGATPGAQVTATLTILDDDAAPIPGTVQFDSSTYTVNETAGTATITVTRTVGSDGEVSVNFSTTGIAAEAGTDFQSTSGVLTFADGDSAPKTFTITILDDNEGGTNETVRVTLSDPAGGITLGTATATLTIVENDGPAVNGGGGSGGSSGGGCTISPGAAPDPTLPTLMLISMLYLVRRRWQGNF